MLVFLAFRLAAADAFPITSSVLTLSPGITGVDIQKALDSLPATGGEVDLPAGRIEIHAPIILCRDDLTLRGAGPTTILHLADDANCPVIILGEPVNAPARIIRHLLVTGFFIDGNRFHQQRELWRLSGEGCQIRNNGITIQGVSDAQAAFFPLEADQIDNAAPQTATPLPDGVRLALKKSDQLAKTPARLDGVLNLGPGRVYAVSVPVRPLPEQPAQE